MLSALVMWVGNYLEQFMVAQNMYGLRLIGEIPRGAPMGIPLFSHSVIQEISMYTQSSLTNLISMIWKLLVFIQPETSSGNTLFAMFITFGSLMNCLSCSWI